MFKFDIHDMVLGLPYKDSCVVLAAQWPWQLKLKERKITVFNFYYCKTSQYIRLYNYIFQNLEIVNLLA